MTFWKETEIVIKIPRPIEVCYRLLKFSEQACYRGKIIYRGVTPDGTIATLDYAMLAQCSNPDPEEEALWTLTPNWCKLASTKDQLAERLYNILVKFDAKTVNLDILGLVPYRDSDIVDLHFFAFTTLDRDIEKSHIRTIFPLLPKLGWIDIEEMVTGTKECG